MERLGDEDGVHGFVVDRNRLGPPRERLHGGNVPLQDRPHRRQRLDRDDVRVSLGEERGQLAGSRRQIEHPLRLDSVEDRRRPAGATPVVGLGERRVPETLRVAHAATATPRKGKPPRAGAECAGEDLNLHGV